MKRILSGLSWVLLSSLFLALIGWWQRYFVAQVSASQWSEKHPAFWFSLLGLMGLSLAAKPFFIFLWLRLWQGENTPRALLSYAVRETMRAWGSILTWGLFFIGPGIWRFFELYWTPWVVYHHPEYLTGRISALAESRRWFYQKWFMTILIFLGMELLMSGLVDSLIPIQSLGFGELPGLFSLFLNSFFQSLVFVGTYYGCLNVIRRLK
jgi:hypothetical protein